MVKEKKSITDMVDLLRHGATMTQLACPACSSPLFKLTSGRHWCESCKKPVVVVKASESATKATNLIFFNSLESTILTKIQDMNRRIKEENDLDKLEKLAAILSVLLEGLEKINRIKGKKVI